MVHPENIKQAWFIGIGGIGMSAIARYFHLKGILVAGYDRTQSPVTDALTKEGINIVFSDDPQLIAPSFHNPGETLIVYTPAVEKTNRQLKWFQEKGFTIMKRSQVLGLITQNSKAICIAGTHGKTTISTIASHLFKQSKIGCTAFLGGISKNYKTNFLSNNKSPFTILEADEFDRSFLQLTPSSALISAIDADHLDIYGDEATMRKAFNQFAEQIVPNGNIVIKKGINLTGVLSKGIQKYTYALSEKADFYAENIKLIHYQYHFDLVSPFGIIENIKMGIHGLVNIENAIGAAAVALLNGVSGEEIKKALPTFQGIARRFEIIMQHKNFVFIDDYAHHPQEIDATLKSIKAMYPGYSITGIFQPHLYTRTRDFASGFSQALAQLDELLLLDIYPAREQPIPGITSEIIAEKIKNIPVLICSKEELPGKIKIKEKQVLLTIGAGDIDREVPKIKKHVETLINK